RFPHMLLASYLTGAVCVAATGAWYVLRGIFTAEARVMLRMGSYLAAALLPAQLVFGHLNGEYIVHHQPSKMAAIEARWHDEKPASEVLLAWPDVENHRNLFAITLPPPLGSLIDSDSLTAGEVGLQPWVVYGVLRTAEAMTPFLTARTVAVSLAVYCVVYSFIFAFGTYYIYRLLRAGPEGRLVLPPAAAVPNRPMSVVDEHRLTPATHNVAAGE